jgi:hypothetical protein
MFLYSKLVGHWANELTCFLFPHLFRSYNFYQPFHGYQYVVMALIGLKKPMRVSFGERDLFQGLPFLKNLDLNLSY